MKSLITLPGLLWTGILVVALQISSSTAARKPTEILAECDPAECPEGPYCFGFLNSKASTHNGGRGMGQSGVNGTDPCFDQPSIENCKDRPWAAVSLAKSDPPVFKIELVGKENSVGMIMFPDIGAEEEDPLTHAQAAAFCDSSNDKVKLWFNKDAGSWADRAADETTNADISKHEDGHLVCEFKLEAKKNGVDLTDGQGFRVALFEGGVPPAEDKITSSDSSLTFFMELKERTTVKPSQKQNAQGDVNGSESIIRCGASETILLGAACIIGMVISKYFGSDGF